MSSNNQRYVEGVDSTVSFSNNLYISFNLDSYTILCFLPNNQEASDFATGHDVDCLLDLDLHKFTVKNLTTGKTHQFDGLPIQEYVPHFNQTRSGDAFTITPILPSDFGSKYRWTDG